MSLQFSLKFRMNENIPGRNLQEDSILFEERFSRCCPLLHFLAFRILGSDEEVEDAVQSCRITASRQTHFLEKFGVSSVLVEASHQRIGFKSGCTRVALSIGTIEPFECFVSLSPICVDLGNLIGAIVLVGGNEFLQSAVRLLATAKRVVRQRFTRQLLPLADIVCHLHQSFLLAPFGKENLAASEMQGRKLGVQVLSPL